MSENTVSAALRSMGYAKEVMTAHGFRAMARTMLDEILEERVDLIEHQLAHAVIDPNGRAYNRTAHLPGRRQMMQRWADYLDQLRKGGKPWAGNLAKYPEFFSVDSMRMSPPAWPCRSAKRQPREQYHLALSGKTTHSKLKKRRTAVAAPTYERPLTALNTDFSKRRNDEQGHPIRCTQST